MANYSLIFLSLFLISHCIQSVPLSPIQVKNTIIANLASANASDDKNISVVLHSPVIVPALSVSNEAIRAASVQTGAPATDRPHEPLAAEMFNGGVAMVNGSPFFLSPSAGESTSTSPESTTLSSESTTLSSESTTLSPEQNKARDAQSINQSVMKAMEHLQNISQAQGDQRVPLIHQGMDGAMSAVNRTVDATNASFISVVVVPLLQNAFDLTEPGRTSVSQLAARNPVVLTRTDKDGNHTTIHVIVKRETLPSSLLPLPDHNAHGPLRSSDFLAAAAITASNISTTSSSPLTTASNNDSLGVPLSNSHGPLSEADSTSTAAPLSTEKILVLNPATTSSSPIVARTSMNDTMANDTAPILPRTSSDETTGVNMASVELVDLVTEHKEPMHNGSEMIHIKPFVETDTADSSFSNASSIKPSLVIADSPPILHLSPELRAKLVNQETQPVHNPPEVDALSTTPDLQKFMASTLPSAPRAPLVVPLESFPAKPLPPGTFAFLPVNQPNAKNATSASFHALLA